MTPLESPSTADIIYDTVLELLLLDFKNKQIKTNSSDFRHSIIENSTTVLAPLDKLNLKQNKMLCYLTLCASHYVYLTDLK